MESRNAHIFFSISQSSSRSQILIIPRAMEKVNLTLMNKKKVKSKNTQWANMGEIIDNLTTKRIN